MDVLDLEPIKLNGVDFSQQRPVVIAGPCSAETEEQVMNTAHDLAKRGVKIFRAGIWKPRTKPGSFEGIGSEGLKWMKRVKEETGMYTSTEVATAQHVYEALKYGIDMMWIGARTTANPFAVQEIADALRGVDMPILIKNPVNPDLELWIGALMRINQAGLKKIGVIHRGFSTYDKTIYRNLPQWQIPIEIKRRFPNLPVICDPSHIGGRRDLILPLSQQAMDLQFNGLIIESHCTPDDAWSDAKQQVTPCNLFEQVLNKLVIRDAAQSTENIEDLRGQIDKIDEEMFEIFLFRMASIIEDEGYDACQQRSYPNIRVKGDKTCNPETIGIYELQYAEPVEAGKPPPDIMIDFGKAARACGISHMGCSGRIVNREYGPFMRYAFIVTDAPLETNAPCTDDLCAACRAAGFLHRNSIMCGHCGS